MSAIDRLYNQQLQVRRAALASPAAVDEWNQPTYAADATVATVRGRVHQLTDREVATLSDAGAELGDFRAYTEIADIRDSDRVIDAGGVQYEVRGVVNPAGANHHLEILMTKVTD